MDEAIGPPVARDSGLPRLDQRNLTTSRVDTGAIDRFLAEQHPSTPCVVVDLDIVRARYRALQAVLPTAMVLYAVKANPAAEVIAALGELGAGFDLAIGDPVDFLSAGAYTASYAAVEFNGFAPIRTYFV